MRLFTAFTLPAASLQPIQHTFAFPGVRLPPTFHCTLAFFGDIDASTASAITPRLARVSFPSFTITLSHFAAFPDTHKLRIIYLALAPVDVITQFQQAVVHALHPLYAPDKPFIPHVTLARVSFAAHKHALLHALKTRPPPLQFLINSFELIQSDLTPEGPRYTSLHTYPLTSSSPHTPHSTHS